MFEHSWKPIKGFEQWIISDHGEIKRDFTGYIPPLYVRKGQIRVELTDSEGRYVEVKLATILKKAFPKGRQ
jgi:hypothetical protein